jgi:hypothetical protein
MLHPRPVRRIVSTDSKSPYAFLVKPRIDVNTARENREFDDAAT